MMVQAAPTPRTAVKGFQTGPDDETSLLLQGGYTQEGLVYRNTGWVEVLQ